MKLFQGTLLKSEVSNSILRHFGSPLTAAERLESMFVDQERRAYSKDGFCTVISFQDVQRRKETIGRALIALCDFLIPYIIIEVKANINKPFRLSDCWGDDRYCELWD